MPYSTGNPKVSSQHLSLVIKFDEAECRDGLPTPDLLRRSKSWQDDIEPFIALNPDKPNALPFAIDTHSASREFIYRIYDPRPPHEYLQELIERDQNPFL